MAARPIDGDRQEFSLPITRENLQQHYIKKLDKIDSLITEITEKNLTSVDAQKQISSLKLKRAGIESLIAPLTRTPNVIADVNKRLDTIINLANTILSKDKKIEASESEVKVGSSKTISDSSNVKTMSPKQIKEEAIAAQKTANAYLEDLKNKEVPVEKEIEKLRESFKIVPGKITSRFDDAVKKFEDLKKSLKTLNESFQKINEDVDFNNELKTLDALTNFERIVVKDSREISKELSTIKEEITKLKELSVPFQDVTSMSIAAKHLISKFTKNVETLNLQVQEAEKNHDFSKSPIGKKSISEAKKALAKVNEGLVAEKNSIIKILEKLSNETIPDKQKKLVKEMTDIKSKISQLEDDISNINLDDLPKKIKTTFIEVGKGLLSTGSKPSKEFIDDRLDLDKDPLDDLEEST